MIRNWPSHLWHDHSPEAISERLSVRDKSRFIRDLVYGAIDGSVTTFSIVAGVSGAELSDAVILILGFSNVLSDGFSMAAGNYLGTKAEQEERILLKNYEDEQIKLNPAGEVEEIRQIFKAKGFEGDLLNESVLKVTQNRDEWIRLMLSEEYGLPIHEKSPLKAGGVTFMAFLIFGLVPLIPYAVGLQHDFFISVVLTGFSFFSLGALKSKWSLESAWVSGCKTFIIGSGAASLAYFVGVNLKDLVH